MTKEGRYFFAFLKPHFGTGFVIHQGMRKEAIRIFRMCFEVHFSPDLLYAFGNYMYFVFDGTQTFLIQVYKQNLIFILFTRLGYS